MYSLSLDFGLLVFNIFKSVEMLFLFAQGNVFNGILMNSLKQVQIWYQKLMITFINVRVSSDSSCSPDCTWMVSAKPLKLYQVASVSIDILKPYYTFVKWLSSELSFGFMFGEVVFQFYKLKHVFFHIPCSFLHAFDPWPLLATACCREAFSHHGAAATRRHGGDAVLLFICSVYITPNIAL